MTDIIFSFDTEDYTSNRAADGIIEAAELLHEEGIRGCFCMVGLLAEQLQVWGRKDVVEALKYHDIGYHSYAHTMHPTINEYTDIEDFSEAYEEFLRQETKGLDIVKALTGTGLVSAVVPPGPNESYVAMYGYHDLGIPCYATEMVDAPNGRVKFFCNNLSLFYYTYFEDIVEKELAADRKFFDQMAEREHVVVASHPNRWLYRDFYDFYNFNQNNRKFGEWQEASPMTDNEREHFRNTVRSFIRNLKKDGRFRFVTYREMAEKHCCVNRIIEKKDMDSIRKQLRERFYPITRPESLCIADIFAAAVKFLRGNRLFAAGRVYGFLDTPYGITEPVTVTAAEIKAAAEQIQLDTFLPISIMAGEKKLGPADLLFAMLDVLAGEQEVNLVPRPQNIDLSGFGALSNPPLDGWLFSPTFKAEILKKRMPLQAWTIRF